LSLEADVEYSGAIPLDEALTIAKQITAALSRKRTKKGSSIAIYLTLIDWRQHPEREQRIRDLFTRNGIAPVQDDRGDRELILMYPLPDSAQRISSLCSEVLTSG
jgi:hypothetical protein